MYNFDYLHLSYSLLLNFFFTFFPFIVSLLGLASSSSLSAFFSFTTFLILCGKKDTPLY